METTINLPGLNEGVRTDLSDFDNATNTVGGGGLGSLTQADFLRLLTTQLANQDPLEPVSNEEMLAQLAQFTSLEAETASADTLSEISDKLDALTAAQEAAVEAATSAAEAAMRAAEAAELAAQPQIP